MRRITFTGYETVFSAVYLGLMTNLALLVACLPLVVLLVTTDPARSWPMLAVAAPLCGPAVAGAFTAFREHQAGGAGVLRAFATGWRTCFRRSLTLAALVTAVLVVLAVDVRALAPSSVGVAAVPALAVLAVVTVATGVVAMVAITEAPEARLRDVLRASAVLMLRRWYLTGASLVALGVQAVFFTSSPALAIGLTAAPLWYVAWANGRYTLRPALAETPGVVTA